MSRFTLIVIPGTIAPLEKSKGHPAGISKVKAPLDTNNPSVSHRERIKFAKQAMRRAISPENAKAHTPAKVVDHKGRKAGQKAPHSNYKDQVSGSGSKASDSFNAAPKTTLDFGFPKPEKSTAHTPVKSACKHGRKMVSVKQRG